MIYLLGGVSRSGKGDLSKVLPAVLGARYEELDPLIASQSYGAEVKSDEDRARIAWPFIEERIKTAQIAGENVLFEGVSLLPEFVLKFPDAKACFLGYVNADPAERAQRTIDNDMDGGRYAGKTKEWIIEQFVIHVNESKKLQEECQKLGLKYFDTSTDRENVLKQAQEFMTAKTI